MPFFMRYEYKISEIVYEICLTVVPQILLLSIFYFFAVELYRKISMEPLLKFGFSSPSLGWKTRNSHRMVVLTVKSN